MSIWNDLSWVESIRTPFLSFFFESITLMGYPTCLLYTSDAADDP